uniref:Uncharacterized protein n=1 Tax=Oryza barthii TaxID=65489 RepID=A0A0D3GM17_9ORYZ
MFFLIGTVYESPSSSTISIHRTPCGGVADAEEERALLATDARLVVARVYPDDIVNGGGGGANALMRPLMKPRAPPPPWPCWWPQCSTCGVAEHTPHRARPQRDGQYKLSGNTNRKIKPLTFQNDKEDDRIMFENINKRARIRGHDTCPE